MSTLALPRRGTARAAAFGEIVRNEARLAWRTPTALIGSIAVPVVLTVIFGALPKFHQSSSSLGGLTGFEVYEPLVLMLGLAMLTLWGLPGPLASYREQGILRRLSTTPVPPSWLLTAQVAVQLCAALAGYVIVIGLSVTAFGAAAPVSPGGLVLALALATAAMFALGLLIAALAPSASSVNVIGRVTLIPLMFFAGLWLPRALMPPVLSDIASYTPLGAAAEAIQDSMQTGFPPVAPLLTLAAYAVVFGLAARRWFRWQAKMAL